MCPGRKRLDFRIQRCPLGQADLPHQLFGVARRRRRIRSRRVELLVSALPKGFGQLSGGGGRAESDMRVTVFADDGEAEHEFDGARHLVRMESGEHELGGRRYSIVGGNSEDIYMRAEL